jgi:uncharacterized protein (DUF1697 family)
MQYLALLRGINVGGNGIIKMSNLKKAVEECGFTDVKTYIQSGNVIFRSALTDSSKVTRLLEECLLKKFNLNSAAVVITHQQIADVVAEVPPEWNTSEDIRCYIAFVRETVTVQDVINSVKLKEGVDFVKAGKGVVYMTTLISGLTKSGFTKLVGSKIYKEITMRNYNTTRKLLELMNGAA